MTVTLRTAVVWLITTAGAVAGGVAAWADLSHDLETIADRTERIESHQRRYMPYESFSRWLIEARLREPEISWPDAPAPPRDF